MHRTIRLPLFVLPLLASTACGTMTHGTSQDISCVSHPAGAVVRTADGKTCTTPCSLTLNRKHEEILTIEKEGYEPETLPVHSSLSKGSAGQILLPGGLMYWAIDLASGGAFRLAPESVDIELKSKIAENRSKDS